MNALPSRYRAYLTAVALAWLAGPGITAPADADANPLACRLASYGKFQDAAWSHLPAIGFHYVFISVPPPDQIDAVKARLAENRLRVAVVRGDTDLSRATCLEELAVQLRTCEALGVKYMFLSPKHTGIDKEEACKRLRAAGDIAKKHGVTITLETHPDLGTNGDVHLETMKRIDHPNVRVNFDTANITYYNRNTDALTELKKIIDYVGTVEIKDHSGEFKTWNFPVLGEGVVDIPEVLNILKQHSYSGPITLEIEGIEGVSWDETQTRKAIADSAAYVRSLGKFR